MLSALKIDGAIYAIGTSTACWGAADCLDLCRDFATHDCRIRRLVTGVAIEPFEGDASLYPNLASNGAELADGTPLPDRRGGMEIAA